MLRECGVIGKTGAGMSGKTSKRAKMTACAMALCLCTMTVGTGAVADAPAHNGYIVNSSSSDLMRAHNDRVLVIFGASIKFKRYFLVDLLSQSMTVATDTSNVRYSMRETSNERTLVID
jgi:hypothetical protein